MIAHWIDPESTSLPFCAAMAYRNGELPGYVVHGFVSSYHLTCQRVLVTCPDCLEWIHA